MTEYLNIKIIPVNEDLVILNKSIGYLHKFQNLRALSGFSYSILELNSY